MPRIQTPAGEEREFIRQGEALLVWLPLDGGDAPAVAYQRQRVTLVSVDGRWSGVIGVPPWAAPGPAAVTVSSSGRSVELPLPVRAVDFPVQRITLPPAVAPLSAPAVLNDEQGFLDGFFAVRTPQRLWQGSFLQPLAAGPPTPFGLQRVFNGQPTGHHLGVDYSADEGAPVAAANAGRVALARRLDVRGNAIILDHGGGLFSGYYHLSQMAVAEGQGVAKGQRLGLVGSTGLATGPHLHWEMRVGSNPVDPLPWLEAQGEG